MLRFKGCSDSPRNQVLMLDVLPSRSFSALLVILHPGWTHRWPGSGSSSRVQRPSCTLNTSTELPSDRVIVQSSVAVSVPAPRR